MGRTELRAQLHRYSLGAGSAGTVRRLHVIMQHSNYVHSTAGTVALNKSVRQSCGHSTKIAHVQNVFQACAVTLADKNRKWPRVAALLASRQKMRHTAGTVKVAVRKGPGHELGLVVY